MQQLGRYRILDEIGRGGFATVYRALDPGLDREVAVKVLHPVLLADPAFIQRFRREARSLAALRHQHILMVFEVSESDGRLFIVMELANGPSLSKRIEESGPVGWDETLEIFQPVCEALEYAHRMDIVHRDLKPSNILLDRERGALLSDFGLARAMSASTTTTVTSPSGGILGTPSYIAPELWDFEIANAASDIYALGCILYEMLTGKLLFAGNTPVQVLRAHDRGPRFPDRWPDAIPEAIEAVLRKALDKEPKERYASPMQLFRALESLSQPVEQSRPPAAAPAAPIPDLESVRGDIPQHEPALEALRGDYSSRETTPPTPEMIPVTVTASAMPVSEPVAPSTAPVKGQGRQDAGRQGTGRQGAGRLDGVRWLLALAALGAGAGFFYVFRDYHWTEYGRVIQGFGIAYLALFVLLLLPTGRALRASGVFRVLALLIGAALLGLNLWMILPYKSDQDYQFPLMLTAGAQGLLFLLLFASSRRVPAAAAVASATATEPASATATEPASATASATATPLERAPARFTRSHGWMVLLALLFAGLWYNVGRFFQFYPTITFVITIALAPGLLFLYLMPGLRKARALLNVVFLAALLLLGGWWYYAYANEMTYMYEEIRLQVFSSVLAGWGLFVLLLADRRTLSSAHRGDLPAHRGDLPAHRGDLPAHRGFGTRQALIVLLGLVLTYAWFFVGRWYGFEPPAVLFPVIFLPPLVISVYFLLADGQIKRTLRVVMIGYFLLSALAWTVIILEDISGLEPEKIVAFIIARFAELGLFFLLLRVPSDQTQPARAGATSGAEAAAEPAGAAPIPSGGALARILPSLTPRQIWMIVIALTIAVTWYVIADYFDFEPDWLFSLAILLPPVLVALYLAQSPFLERARPVIRLSFMSLMFASSILATLLYVSSPGEEITLGFLAGRLGEVVIFIFLLRDLLPPAAIPRHG